MKLFCVFYCSSDYECSTRSLKGVFPSKEDADTAILTITDRMQKARNLFIERNNLITECHKKHKEIGKVNGRQYVVRIPNPNLSKKQLKIQEKQLAKITTKIDANSAEWRKAYQQIEEAYQANLKELFPEWHSDRLAYFDACEADVINYEIDEVELGEIQWL